MTIKKYIPKLRFPGFEGEWKMAKLEDVAFVERGKFTPRPRNDPAYYGGNTPFVQTSDVVNSNGAIESFSQTLNEKGLSVSKLFPKGTILITIAANIGYTGVLQIDMACPDSLIGIRCKKTTDNRFLNIFLSTKQKHMDYLAPEGAQKNINIEFLSPYKVPVSTLPEQQKIASFLSAVDRKIQQLTRKKELLEQYKRGVMQKIFSREIRFKDENGKDYQDWEEKRLGDVGDFKNGINKDKKDFGFGCFFVNLLDVFGKNIIQKGKFGKVNANKKELIQYDIKKGDVLFIRSSVKRSGVGETVLVLEDIPNTVYSGFLIRFREYNQSMDLLFKKYCFAFSLFRKELLSFATTSANTNINQESLSKLLILLPSFSEQQIITLFLSSINKKIESIKTQLTQTQTFKKGLLQHMFI